MATSGPFPRFDLEGQTALVTGAARGIGRSIALALAHAGADVALGLRDASTAEDLAEEIRSMGRRAVRVQMDPEKLHAQKIGINEVDQAITNWNVNQPTGQLYGANRTYPIRASGQLMIEMNQWPNTTARIDAARRKSTLRLASRSGTLITRCIETAAS